MKKLLFLAVIIPLLTGCFSASPVAKLDSLDENIRWDYGQQLITKTKNDITVKLSFNKSTEKYLVFDAEIINESDNEALIAPESFYYRCKNKYGTALGQPEYAVNPEDKLLEIDYRITKHNAHDNNQAVLSVLSTTADAAGLIASVNDDQEIRNRVMENVSANQYHRNNMWTETRDKTISLREKREYWAHNVLRKTTLKQGYHIGGKIFFPRNNHASHCRFILPINQTHFTFEYRQQLLTP